MGLNDSTKKFVRLSDSTKKFEEFYGNYAEKMPLLIADERTPISVAQVMERRLELRNSNDKELKDNWCGYCIDTGDGGLYLPDGTVGVMYDARALRELTSESKLVNGGLVLEDLTITDIKGQIFTKNDIEKMILGKELSLKQSRDHPMWRALARDNNTLLRDYTEMIFKDKGYDTGMAISSMAPSNVPSLRNWLVGPTSRSGANSNNSLRSNHGCLVGVELETRNARMLENEEETRSYTVKDLEGLSESIKKLEGIIDSNILEKLQTIESKLK